MKMIATAKWQAMLAGVLGILILGAAGMGCEANDNHKTDTANDPNKPETEELAFTGDAGQKDGPSIRYDQYPGARLYTLSWNNADNAMGKRYLYSNDGRLLATLDSIKAYAPMNESSADTGFKNQAWMRLHLPSGYMFAEGWVSYRTDFDDGGYMLMGDWMYRPMEGGSRKLTGPWRMMPPLDGGAGWEALSALFLTI